MNDIPEVMEHVDPAQLKQLHDGLSRAAEHEGVLDISYRSWRSASAHGFLTPLRAWMTPRGNSTSILRNAGQCLIFPLTSACQPVSD